MAQHLIRWRKGDYIRLGQAVSQFNKKINELEKDEMQIDYLPDLRNYKDLKEHITTRNELNRVINSLRRFKKEGAEDLYTTQAGQDLTKWEYSELKRQRTRAIRTLKKEAMGIYDLNIGMGNERLQSINATIKSLNKLDEKVGYEFKRLSERLNYLGASDYKLKQDKLFRDNYMKALQSVSNFENYDILKNKLDKIKNPTKFYEFISKSNVLMDLFIYYDDNSGTLVYGGFSSNEEAFNNGLIELGIQIDEKSPFKS